MIKIGLDKYKRAIEHSGIDKVLEETIIAYKRWPSIWKGNDGWDNVQWAFDRSWKHILWDNHLSNCNVGSTFNIIDVIDPGQMKYLADNLQLDVNSYKPYFIEEQQ
jgi:hypothetical protein